MLPELLELIICNTIKCDDFNKLYYKKLKHTIQRTTDIIYLLQNSPLMWKFRRNNNMKAVDTVCVYCNEHILFNYYSLDYKTLKDHIFIHNNCIKPELKKNIDIISPNWYLLHLLCKVCGEVSIYSYNDELKQNFLDKHRDCRNYKEYKNCSL
jgi:hypothetical protein